MEYEVKRIIGKKGRNDRLKYKVQWRGYPKEEATWEPMEHLQHCQQKIDKYERKLERMRQEFILDEAIEDNHFEH